MEVKRRTFLLALPAAGLALYCSAPVQRSANQPYSEIEATKLAQGSVPTIVVFMPRTPQAMDVWVGLRDELAADFRVVAVEVSGRGCAPVIVEGIRRHRPSAIVLMNNPTLAAYREVQRSSLDTRFPPAVVVMSSFVEDRLRGSATKCHSSPW